MDVLNEKEIARVVVDPLLSRIHAETIPALKAALNETLANGTSGISTAAGGLVELIASRFETQTIPMLKAAIVEALGDVLRSPLQRIEDIVDRLDGASLSLGKKPL